MEPNPAGSNGGDGSPEKSVGRIVVEYVLGEFGVETVRLQGLPSSASLSLAILEMVRALVLSDLVAARLEERERERKNPLIAVPMPRLM